MSDSRIIVALDYANASDAMQMADQIDPKRARVKVGKELFTRSGPQVVPDLVSSGFDFFLYLKYTHIPHTIAQARAPGAAAGG